MELKSLFGLPAHPFIVHAAVVLLPLAAILTIGVAVWPKLRKSYGLVAVGMAFVATIAVFLAEQSGEQLEEQVKESALVRAHSHAADAVLPWAFGVLVIAALVYFAPRIAERIGERSLKPFRYGLIAFAVILGIGATWTVIDVGHSGAKATWNEVQLHPANNERGGEDGE